MAENRRRRDDSDMEEEEEEDRLYNEEGMQRYMSDEANVVVRDKYDRLMSTIHSHTDEENRLDMHELQLLVLEANEAFIDVKRPREAALDAQLLKVCGSLVRHTIESSQSNLINFDHREFGEKLIAYAMKPEGEETDYENEKSIIGRLTTKVTQLFPAVPGLQPMFCAIEGEKPKVKERKKRKPKAPEAYGKAKKLQVAAANDNQAEEEAEALSWMNKCLKLSYADNDNKPIPFFEFAVDPNSFSRTIENLFHISMLVREQYAELIEDENELPNIRPTISTAMGKEREEGRQCILSMDMEEWKSIVKTFGIKRAMIPPRPKNQRSKKK